MHLLLFFWLRRKEDMSLCLPRRGLVSPSMLGIITDVLQSHPCSHWKKVFYPFIWDLLGLSTGADIWIALVCLPFWKARSLHPAALCILHPSSSPCEELLREGAFLSCSSLNVSCKHIWLPVSEIRSFYPAASNHGPGSIASDCGPSLPGSVLGKACFSPALIPKL